MNREEIFLDFFKSKNASKELTDKIFSSDGQVRDSVKKYWLFMDKITEVMNLHMDEVFLHAVENSELLDFLENPKDGMEKSTNLYAEEYQKTFLKNLSSADAKKMDEIFPLHIMKFYYKKLFTNFLRQIPSIFNFSNQIKARLYQKCNLFPTMDEEEMAERFNAVLRELPKKVDKIRDQLRLELQDAFLDQFNEKKISKETLQIALEHLTKEQK